MTHEAFDHLVAQIEERYKDKTAALQRAVLMWVALGYGWFLGWIAAVLVLGISIVFAGFQVGGIAGLLILAAGSAFLVFGLAAVWHGAGARVSAPEGRKLKKAEAPALFAEIKELRKRLSTLPFHSVLLTAEFNAGVAQQPRLGIFGWWKNYLLLGLPLMEMLSLNDFRAVLAHEFAHLSHRHGRLGHWLYRLRLAWGELFDKLGTETRPHEISFRRASVLFLKWFWPRFNAHAFVLSRHQEYQADHLAGTIVGPQQMVAALIRTSIVGQSLETKFWPNLWCVAAAQPAPVPDFIERIVGSELQDRMSAGDNAVKALQAISTNADTHPCLYQRAFALGWDQQWPDLYNPGEPSTLTLFGQNVTKLREELNTLWRKNAAKGWLERHQRASALKSRLEVIDKNASVDAEALWDQTAIKMQVEGLQAAEPMLRDVLTRDPYHIGARFALGESLLMRDDPEGIQHVEYAVQLEEECTLRACEVLAGFFRRSGDSEGLRGVARKIDYFEKSIEASRKERRTISRKDRFVAHELPEKELDAMVEVLKKQTKVKTVWLVRKTTEYFNRQGVYVLALETTNRKEPENEIIEKLLSDLVIRGRLMIVSARGPFAAIYKMVKKAAGAEIYQKA